MRHVDNDTHTNKIKELRCYGDGRMGTTSDTIIIRYSDRNYF